MVISDGKNTILSGQVDQDTRTRFLDGFTTGLLAGAGAFNSHHCRHNTPDHRFKAFRSASGICGKRGNTRRWRWIRSAGLIHMAGPPRRAGAPEK